LQRVWRDKQIKSMGFDASNTLLVEADPRKAVDCKTNTLMPPEFNETHVPLRGAARNKTLRVFGEYLETTFLTTIQEPGMTVAQVLKRHPFKIGGDVCGKAKDDTSS
jgi:hypothetical protein